MPTSNSTESEAGNSMLSSGFGNGLLEISALTTLIGSNHAVSLILGSRGAAGLAWGSTSAFGSFGVIRACVGAATSGWLREMVGVRTAGTDGAVGMDLELSGSVRAPKVRKNMEEPKGIICDSRIDSNGSKDGSRSWSDVYAFDHPTAMMLSTISETQPDNPLRVFTYAQYDFRRIHDAKFQLLTILFSFSKVAEAYVLWAMGSGKLGLASVLPWAYFVMVSLIVESYEIILSRKPENTLGHLDVISGYLPAGGQPGGARKVVLGASENPRRSYKWRVMWALGAIIFSGSLIETYFLLSQLSNNIVYLWAGFQTFWLFIRILVHHFSEPQHPLLNRVLEGQHLHSLPNPMKKRVAELVLALSKYQSYVHPRGTSAYKDDSYSFSDLISPQLRGICLQYPFPEDKIQNIDTMEVDIQAVIGDTLLSSAAWITGSKLKPIDVYDCCILVFSFPAASSVTLDSSRCTTIAVPSVRVLVGRTFTSSPDQEKNMSISFVPKGSSNLGFGVTWWYWVPLESGKWLQIITEEDKHYTVGRWKAQVLSDAQLTGKLSEGSLNISLTHVEDIKTTLETSRAASNILLGLIPT